MKSPTWPGSFVHPGLPLCTLCGCSQGLLGAAWCSSTPGGGRPRAEDGEPDGGGERGRAGEPVRGAGEQRPAPPHRRARHRDLPHRAPPRPQHQHRALRHPEALPCHQGLPPQPPTPPSPAHPRTTTTPIAPPNPKPFPAIKVSHRAPRHPLFLLTLSPPPPSHQSVRARVLAAFRPCVHASLALHGVLGPAPPRIYMLQRLAIHSDLSNGDPAMQHLAFYRLRTSEVERRKLGAAQAQCTSACCPAGL